MIHHQGHIFGIGSELSDMDCARVKYDPHNVHPIGSKVLVNREALNFIKGGSLINREDKLRNHMLETGIPSIPTEIETHGLFPARYNGGIFINSRIGVENLRVVNGNRLFNLHYIKPIEKFSMGTINYVIKYAKHWGAITLKFVGHQEAANFVNKLKAIFKLYNHYSSFGSNFQHTSSAFFKHATCKFYATFIDVSYCVPIWNPKKVDGMGLIISLVSDDTGQPNGMPLVAFNSAIMLTNYEENIFKVDGCVANPHENVGNDLIDMLLNMTTSAQKFEEYHMGKKGKGKAKAKVKTKSVGDTIRNNDVSYRYLSTNSTYVGSSTANTYYTTS